MKNNHNNLFNNKYRLIIQRLKELRKKAGLTQVDLAKKMSKPQSEISKIENFERRIDALDFISWIKNTSDEACSEIKGFIKLYEGKS